MGLLCSYVVPYDLYEFVIAFKMNENGRTDLLNKRVWVFLDTYQKIEVIFVFIYVGYS